MAPPKSSTCSGSTIPPYPASSQSPMARPDPGPSALASGVVRHLWQRPAATTLVSADELASTAHPDSEENPMNAARKLASGIAYTAGAALIAAGPVMIYEGVHGQHEVTTQLSEQLISFPAKGSAGLPAAQAG